MDKQEVAPHIDSQNCKEVGYNITAIMAIVINSNRCTWIGYNKKSAHDYMTRKRACIQMMKWFGYYNGKWKHSINW